MIFGAVTSERESHSYLPYRICYTYNTEAHATELVHTIQKPYWGRAGAAGLEPATTGVTDHRKSLLRVPLTRCVKYAFYQLNYTPIWKTLSGQQDSNLHFGFGIPNRKSCCIILVKNRCDYRVLPLNYVRVTPFWFCPPCKPFYTRCSRLVGAF